MSIQFNTEEETLLQSPVSPMASPEEQDICIDCGLCCDGTLFSQAVLRKSERGNLPPKIEESSVTGTEADYYFNLPCGYFAGRCSIYESRRPEVCSRYRCQILHDISGGKISAEKAKDVVSQAKVLREEIINLYSGTTIEPGQPVCFRKVLIEMGKMQNYKWNDEHKSGEFEFLLARCNIFEALLIKHFRSPGDFDKMTEHEQISQKQ